MVHLIRAATRFVAYADRKAVLVALRKIYTAPDEQVAKEELEAFARCELGKKYPSAVKTWEDAWERFTPFLQFAPAVRKVIYTTNAIESLNYQLRKVTKNRGHFPSTKAAMKLLWLAITNTEDKRARERATRKDKASKQAKTAPGKLIEGQSTIGWNQALAQLAIAYPNRFNNHI